MEAVITRDPVISVIVPVYHVEAWLPGCLDSILSQTFPDFELILVNDGGNEEETRIAEEYAGKDPRIVYIRQENQGLSAARNAAMDKARGEWLLFCDGDDWIEKDTIAACLRAAEEHSADIVQFRLTYDGEGFSYPDNFPLPEGTYGPEDILKEILTLRFPPNICNKLIRRSLTEGIRFPEGEKWEDVATGHRIIARASRIYLLDRFLYHYIQRPDAITKEA